MRRISLLTMVISPIATGQLLSRTSHSAGALAVAGWNLATVFLEYFLLWKLYQEVPQLRKPKLRGKKNTYIYQNVAKTLFAMTIGLNKYIVT